jgi:hypothetical protein
VLNILPAQTPFLSTWHTEFDNEERMSGRNSIKEKVKREEKQKIATLKGTDQREEKRVESNLKH